LMFVFGVVHLEFFFKAWTLCLMCIIALFYSNPNLNLILMQMTTLNGQFEFS
jgi:hypothetical protein